MSLIYKNCDKMSLIFSFSIKKNYKNIFLTNAVGPKDLATPTHFISSP